MRISFCAKRNNEFDKRPKYKKVTQQILFIVLQVSSSSSCNIVEVVDVDKEASVSTTAPCRNALRVLRFPGVHLAL